MTDDYLKFFSLWSTATRAVMKTTSFTTESLIDTQRQLNKAKHAFVDLFRNHAALKSGKNGKYSPGLLEMTTRINDYHHIT